MEIQVSTISNEIHSTERNISPNKWGDVYLASTNTQSDQNVWLIDSGEFYHMTTHIEWFCEYERYEGGDVFQQRREQVGECWIIIFFAMKV
jgi:hypothetical protein